MSPVASQGILSFFLLGVNVTLGFKQPGAAGALTPTSKSFLLEPTLNLGAWRSCTQAVVHGAGGGCDPDLCHPSSGWLKGKPSEEKLSSRGPLCVRVNSGCVCSRYAYIRTDGSLKHIAYCAVERR